MFSRVFYIITRSYLIGFQTDFYCVLSLLQKVRRPVSLYRPRKNRTEKTGTAGGAMRGSNEEQDVFTSSQLVCYIAVL